MTGLKRKVTGDINEIRCNGCRSVFYCFMFSGENDTETSALCSATRCNTSEVTIAEATPDEWNAFDNGGFEAFEKRLTENLNIPDLKVLRLLRMEQPNNSMERKSFQDFLQKYKLPSLVYICPCCENGEAHVVEAFTVNEFQSRGGGVIAIGSLSIEQA